MDYGLLVIFLAAGCWLYAAAMLAYLDWRWNLGRIILCALAGAASGWMVYRNHTGPHATLVVLVLFIATVFLPVAVQWAVRRLLAGGRVDGARLLDYLAALLIVRPPSRVFPAVERVLALMAEEGPSAFEAERQGRWFLRLQGSASRRAFLEARIEALATLHDYADAIRLYEEQFGPGRLRPGAMLLYVMVIPYGDTGELLKAIHCLRSAEDARQGGGLIDLRRFIAYLRLYAQSGRIYALERLLDRHPDLTGHLPIAYVRLWRGVALLRRGEADAGVETLRSALQRVHPGEERIGRLIEEYLSRPPVERGPLPLSGEASLALDAIETIEDRPSSTEQLGPVRPPMATYVLVALCVAVWLLTELFGSSTDTLTLVRFGANVPDMVRYGDWWRLVSSVFLHIGMLHLFFNMYACYLFGAFIERLAGRWEAFVVFMVSGVVGSLSSAFLGAHDISAGASGAVFGLLGAATVIALRFRGLPASVRRMYAFNFIFMAAINMAYGFFETRIDNFAHAGGFAAGVVAGFWLSPAGSTDWRRRLFRVAGPVFACVLGVSAVFTISNVEAGYPRRTPPLKRYTSVDGQWSVQVPAFWRVTEKASNTLTVVDPGRRVPGHAPRPPRMRAPSAVVFADPLGAEFEVIVRPGPAGILRPDANESLLGLRERRVGNARYLEADLIVTNHDPRLARVVFLGETVTPAPFPWPCPWPILLPGRACTLVFQCEAQDLKAYRNLIDRLLLGFDLHESL